MACPRSFPRASPFSLAALAKPDIPVMTAEQAADTYPPDIDGGPDWAPGAKRDEFRLTDRGYVYYELARVALGAKTGCPLASAAPGIQAEAERLASSVEMMNKLVRNLSRSIQQRSDVGFLLIEEEMLFPLIRKYLNVPERGLLAQRWNPQSLHIRRPSMSSREMPKPGARRALPEPVQAVLAPRHHRQKALLRPATDYGPLVREKFGGCIQYVGTVQMGGQDHVRVALTVKGASRIGMPEALKGVRAGLVEHLAGLGIPYVPGEKYTHEIPVSLLRSMPPLPEKFRVPCEEKGWGVVLTAEQRAEKEREASRLRMARKRRLERQAKEEDPALTCLRQHLADTLAKHTKVIVSPESAARFLNYLLHAWGREVASVCSGVMEGVKAECVEFIDVSGSRQQVCIGPQLSVMFHRSLPILQRHCKPHEPPAKGSYLEKTYSGVARTITDCFERRKVLRQPVTIGEDEPEIAEWQPDAGESGFRED